MKLVPLAGALPEGVSIRTGRALVKAGKLPATKIGRSLFVDLADLERLFAPTLRTPAPRTGRETPTERERRQLAAAGIASTNDQ